VYQSDWLLRQIEQMGEVLRRLVAALREHRPEEAVALSREAVGELLDANPELVDALSGDGLVTMLSAGGTLDTFRAHMLAEVLMGRAEALEQQERTAQAAAERERARSLLLAVAPHVDGPERARARELLEWLGDA